MRVKYREAVKNKNLKEFIEEEKEKEDAHNKKQKRE